MPFHGFQIGVFRMVQQTRTRSPCYASESGLCSVVLFLSELDMYIYVEPKPEEKTIIWKHSSSGDDNIKSKFVSVIIPFEKMIIRIS